MAGVQTSEEGCDGRNKFLRVRHPSPNRLQLVSMPEHLSGFAHGWDSSKARMVYTAFYIERDWPATISELEVKHDQF